MKNLLPLLFVLFAGCNFSSGGALGADNTCGDQADCVDSICEDGICVQTSVAPFRAALQVSRDINEFLSVVPASWTVDAGTIDRSTTLNVDLPETVLVRGEVLWQQEHIPARLTFTRVDGAEGLVAPAAVDVLASSGDLRGAPGETADYAVSLVRDAKYNLVVEPTSDAISEGDAMSVLPPIWILGVSASGADIDVTYPSDLSDSCDNDKPTRCTLAGKIVITPGEGQASGLFVRAVENDTDRVVSSIATTDPEGDFSIRIGAGVGEYSLKINSSSAVDGPLFPVVTVPLSLPLEPPIVVELPQPPPVSFSGVVRGPDGLPVSATTVQFETQTVLDSGLLGELSVTTRTERNGRFATELLPGRYQVLITPDDGRSLGMLFEDVGWLAQDVVDREFGLPRQVVLGGAVSSQDGVPFVSVAVSARARPSSNSLFASLNRSKDATTNSNGVFELLLDKGPYDLQVRPPVESGFAWLVEPDVLLESDDTRNWEYDIPVSISGLIRDGTSAPAAGVTVSLFVEVQGPNGSRALRIAEATTDDDGRYRLLVSPQ